MNGEFLTPPPIGAAPGGRLALVWAGDPKWTDVNLSLDDTKPGDPSITLLLSNTRRSMAMPLAPEQALQLAVEILIRLDIIKPLIRGAA